MQNVIYLFIIAFWVVFVVGTLRFTKHVPSSFGLFTGPLLVLFAGICGVLLPAMANSWFAGSIKTHLDTIGTITQFVGFFSTFFIFAHNNRVGFFTLALPLGLAAQYIH